MGQWFDEVVNKRGANAVSNRAIGAAVVTIPSAAYLIQSRPKREHGHGHDEGDHDGHEASQEGVEKAERGGDHEEKPEDGAQGDVKEGGDGDSPPEDGSTGSEPDKPTRPDHSVEDAGQGTPETPRRDPHEGAHEVQSGGNVEGVRFKGATSGGDRVGEEGQPEQGDVRKHIPDAKGGAKKRISSKYGKPQGGPVEGDEEWPNRRFSSYTPSDKDVASKQEGISNTDTKHSYDLSMDPEKSKKGEGFVETAKVKGPVDPSRPQVASHESQLFNGVN
ncbi:MAG: hypothetical protein Q9207_003758 [Kuettlingeria erythrocarpa]